MMIGKRKSRQITDKVLSLSAADQTEVVILAQDQRLTRFANSTIHQNVAERDAEVRVRAVVGKRIGVASTNDLSDAGLARVVDTALALARLQRENPDFLSLPGPAPVADVAAFSEATAGCTPETRAKGVGDICRRAVAEGLVASGAFTTATQELAVANSWGVFAYFPTTFADLKTVIMSDDGSGYASATSWDVADVNTQAVGAEAVGKALRSRNPHDIEPGRYPVILEDYAVADIVEMLAYLGFSALAVQEGRSFMAGHFGQAMVDSKISIWDDGLDLRGLPQPFDFEGVPKRRVDFFDKGVATAVVYDTYTAGREGKTSTGHALPAPNTFGPFPLNLFMAPGQATKEKMLASMERGLWVTRFHYTRPVHPTRAVVTGMTRDGTFWIENGEIAYPVKNLRFTYSYLDALRHAEQLSNTTRRVRGDMDIGAPCVPALKVTEFEFTGVTQFG